MLPKSWKRRGLCAVELDLEFPRYRDAGVTYRPERQRFKPGLASSVSRDTAPGETKASALESFDRHIDIASPNGLLKISVLYRNGSLVPA
jgi:hypothetical protein